MIKLISNVKDILIIFLVLLFNCFMIEKISNLSTFYVILLNIGLTIVFSFILQFKDIKKKSLILKEIQNVGFNIKKFFIKDLMINYFITLSLLLTWSSVPYILLLKKVTTLNLSIKTLILFYSIIFVLLIFVILVSKFTKKIYEVFDKNYMLYQLLTNFIKFNKDNSTNTIKKYLEDKMNDSYYQETWNMYKEEDLIIFENIYNKHINFKIKCEIRKDKDCIIYGTKLLINNTMVKNIEYFCN